MEEEQKQEENYMFDARKLWLLEDIFKEYFNLFGTIADSRDFLVGKSLNYVVSFSSKSLSLDIKQGLKQLKKQIKLERKQLRKERHKERWKTFKAHFKRHSKARSQSASETADSAPELSDGAYTE